MDTHLTYRDVSERLGIKTNTLYSLVHRHRIPHVRLGKRLVRFPVAELEAWIRGNLIRPADHAAILKKEGANAE